MSEQELNAFNEEVEAVAEEVKEVIAKTETVEEVVAEAEAI